MKLDETYSSINLCSYTNKPMVQQAIFGAGACPHCGRSPLSHLEAVVIGRWNRPSLVERMLQGKKAEFFPKEDEDLIWNNLKQ